jgi:AraC-like DNA-binding protein
LGKSEEPGIYSIMKDLGWPLAIIPEIRLAGRFALGDRDFGTTYSGRNHAIHLHDYAARMRLAGEEVALAPGDVTISPAGGASAYHVPEPGRHWCIHFMPAGGSARSGFTLPLHLRLGTGAAPARERMAHIARLHARGREDAVAAASAALALQELLLWLSDRARPPSPTESAVERAAAIVDERFDEPLTMPAIAREVGRSQGHLARAFRARFGVTLPHRLLQRRAEHARYLLESTDLPIWRVAERVGIPDPHHFNKTMRRLLGASPSAIRAGGGGEAPVDPDR